ncbi:hypothetical protein NEMBOFW57_007102 [Staphylotrichum longicolle]|uniref:F-box domain-containing protein n=1 Tax=Staphylotrichum longicolle TaxID=669026 RepID=A0AAD4EUJ7_9PEZI|nr:hypothetical protein NEMBOFW57_007102 [Staphylotrichum longicolle]
MEWDPEDNILPDEERDQEELAKAWYDEPTRALNRQLVDENLRLKKLLRENGISWSPRLTLDPNDRARGTWASSRRMQTRKSRGTAPLCPDNHHLPTLPVELQVHILEYAMTSDYPIIDPLCKSNKETLTAEEKMRGNQIAIGFLATCKAYQVEGARFLWGNNTFVFTSHLALRKFADLSLARRAKIKHATLRIIARYYDDEDRRHRAPYPSSGEAFFRVINLKAIPRIKEDNLARKGFRSYTWDQVVDFLDALRPPYDPDHPKGQPRPRLLPNLESLRMDFVNFPDSFLNPGGGPFLHNMASHDLGCTLNELQLTGLPLCEWGLEMCSELTGMVKNDGLLLKSDSAFVFTGKQLRSMVSRDTWEPMWMPRVVRSWKFLADEYARSQGKKPNSPAAHPHRHTHAAQSRMPPAPLEEGHPESLWKQRRTVWKRVPISQEDEERIWTEFDRLSGQPLCEDEYDSDEDEYDVTDLICPHCDVMHAPSGGH